MDQAAFLPEFWTDMRAALAASADQDQLVFVSGGRPTVDEQRVHAWVKRTDLRWVVRCGPITTPSPVDPLQARSAPAPLVITPYTRSDQAWIEDPSFRATPSELYTQLREAEDAVCAPPRVRNTDSSNAARPTADPGQPTADPGQPIGPGSIVGAVLYEYGMWTQALHFDDAVKEGDLLAIFWRVEEVLVAPVSPLDPRASKPAPLETKQAHPLPESLEKTTVDQRRGNEAHRVEDLAQGREAHVSAVSGIIDAIQRGDVYQVNYGRLWQQAVEATPKDHWQALWTIFEALQRRNPATMSAWCWVPDLAWAAVSASPEILLQLDQDRLSTRPIKGTRRRSHHGPDDHKAREDLSVASKDAAEHLMLVDLERNDLGRVSVPGSVQATRKYVDGLPSLWHLVTEVHGQLKPPCDAWDAFHALFPGGSITGAPKAASMRYIHQFEVRDRGIWTGSIGWVSRHRGSSMWNICIRTLEYAAGTCLIRAGGGIVAGSDPHEEAQEAEDKAQALLHVSRGLADVAGKPHYASLHLPPVRHSLPAWRAVGTSNGPIYFDTTPEPGAIILLDHADSFVGSIATLLAELGRPVVVLDARSPNLVTQSWKDWPAPAAIVLGPGPGHPEEVPLGMAIARSAVGGPQRLGETAAMRATAASHEPTNTVSDWPWQGVPLLGICLGHQMIALASGGAVATDPHGCVHGEPVTICAVSQPPAQLGVTANCADPHWWMVPPRTQAVRYNSLTVTEVPPQLAVVQRQHNTGQIMGISGSFQTQVDGMQYHPESIGGTGARAYIMQWGRGLRPRPHHA